MIFPTLQGDQLRLEANDARNQFEIRMHLADICMVQANEDRVLTLVEALYDVVRRAHRLRSARVHSSCDKAGLVLLGQLAEQGPMRLSDLAESVQLDPSTVSRQVRALCYGGFAHVFDDPDDKRARRFTISDKGRQEIESVRRELSHVLGCAVDSWPNSDVENLTTLLGQLADDLAAIRTQPMTDAASPMNAAEENAR